MFIVGESKGNEDRNILGRVTLKVANTKIYGLISLNDVEKKGFWLIESADLFVLVYLIEFFSIWYPTGLLQHPSCLI